MLDISKDDAELHNILADYYALNKQYELAIES
jgi:hypothetical protein